MTKEKSEFMRKRLSALIDELCGGVSAELARRTGIDASYVTRMLYEEGKNGKKRIGENTVEKIEKALNVPGWFYYSNEAHQTAAKYAVSSNITTGPEIKRLAPLISWVQAGEFCETSDPFPINDAEDWLPVLTRCGPRTFALKVRGESMHNPHSRPSYEDGDIIFVDPDVEAKNKSRVIVRLENENEATFKELIIEGDRRMLKALNPSWPKQIIEINGDATYCGVVIGKWTPEQKD